MTAASPTHRADGGNLHWTTSNLAEAMPGVLTPLCWTLWDRAVNQGIREASYRIGAYTPAERREQLCVAAFYGRAALAMECNAIVGDRIPGTSGAEVVESFYGPTDMTFHPTRRRYPVVAVRFPHVFAVTPRRLRALAAEQDAWWRRSVELAPTSDESAARSLLADARSRLDHTMDEHITGVLGGVQPVYDGLHKVISRSGVEGVTSLTAPPGGVEMQVVTDIWATSRGRLDLSELRRRYGFHGPHEGELSSKVWREDDAPLRRMIEQYGARDEEQDPARREQQHHQERRGLEARLLAGVPRKERAGVRLLLNLVRTRVPLRGVGKRALVQAFDAARAAGRRLGEHYVAAGAIEREDDIFYFTVDELLRGAPTNSRDLVIERREQREEYRGFELPTKFVGSPVPVTVGPATSGNIDVIPGIGASAGVVEGIARVVEGPSFADVEPDEILVAATTDPSWCSIMFVSSALVMDIGGRISHAAVVARELGIPCVVNTVIGTKEIHTGDRLRVDGTAGTVEILHRRETGKTP